jgi:hypothetical protein
VDTAPPPEPFYGLTTSGQGTISLVGLSFATLQNTNTISSAQLTVYYWDELAYHSTMTLATVLEPTGSVLNFSTSEPIDEGALIQIGGEIIRVEEHLAGSSYQITRGVFDTESFHFQAGQKCCSLASRQIIVPLQGNLFGSAESGTFVHSVFMPDVRVVAAALLVRNSRGNSPVRTQSFIETTSFGLRTLSGGQYSIQLPGFLAIQDDVAPPLIVERSHAVFDIFATVSEAPTGSPVALAVRCDGEIYCSLTISSGSTVSNVVDGLELPPLSGGAVLTLDVVSVGISTLESPGRDLTVTIRL